MSHVASMTPAQLAAHVENNGRIHTEKPFEFEEDDEAQFRCVCVTSLTGGSGSVRVCSLPP